MCINNIIFKDDKEYFSEIYPNIWIMNDHKWAVYCWEKYRMPNTIPATLVHLDYHWDAINDYNKDDSIIKKMELEAIENEIIKNNNIRKDSFIAPAIIRGYINRVDFHCFQTDTPKGLGQEFLNTYNCIENIHSTIEDLVQSIGDQEIVLDLDLDIFNTLGFKGGSLWSTEEIKS